MSYSQKKEIYEQGKFIKALQFISRKHGNFITPKIKDHERSERLGV